MVKKIFILLVFIKILSADEIDLKMQKECNQDSIESYLGIYIVDFFGKSSSFYDKNLEEMIVSKNIGSEYIITKEEYKEPSWQDKEGIKNPIYKIECIKRYKEEGNAPNRNYSDFSGFGMNRDFIKLLKVYENKDDLAQSYHSGIFEIDNNDLWYFYRQTDVILVLKKVGN